MDKQEENALYAIVYWYAYALFGVFPKDKAELAAKTALEYMATHWEESKAVSYVRTYLLYKSDYYQNLKENVA